MKTFEILHVTKTGIDAVTLVRAHSKRQAIERFRSLLRHRKYSGVTLFYPDDSQVETFKFYGQKPIMSTVDILDQTKSTVLCG